MRLVEGGEGDKETKELMLKIVKSRRTFRLIRKEKKGECYKN